MFKLKFITILLAVLSLACNISVLQAKLVDSSEKDMPSWIDKTTEDKSHLFFSGSSLNQSSFETARKLAISDALTKIIESFGLTMCDSTKRIVTDTQSFMEDRTTSKDEKVKVLHTKIKNTYFEKIDDEQGSEIYNVHVLLEYSKKEYEKEKVRLSKEYEQYAQNVVAGLSKAKILIAEYSYSQALVELFDALKIINEYGVSRNSEEEIVPIINDLLIKISFSNSFITSSENPGAIATEIYVCFSGDVEKPYSKAIFDLREINNFSIDSVQSDEKGNINYQFNKVSYLKKANYKLELNLQKTYGFDEDFIKIYKLKNIYEYFNFLSNKKRIYINTNIDNTTLLNFIKSALEENGFTVVDNENLSKLILNVEVSSGEISETILNDSSENSSLFVSKANVKAELITTKNKEIINDASFNEKGTGKTKEKSYSDLLQKISISVINIL